jgi:hypothetical protein
MAHNRTANDGFKNDEDGYISQIPDPFMHFSEIKIAHDAMTILCPRTAVLFLGVCSQTRFNSIISMIPGVLQDSKKSRVYVNMFER